VASLKNPQKIIQRMVSLISRNFNPEKIILFGSYARGDAGPDSDADLLIVMNTGKNRRLRKVEILSKLAGIGLPKDIVIVTPQELEKYADMIGTIIYPAVREGKILYEKTL
jgi:predicted nucleotidyltransferase